MKKVIFSCVAIATISLTLSACQKEGLMEKEAQTSEITPVSTTQQKKIVFDRKANKTTVTSAGGTYDVIVCEERGDDCYMDGTITITKNPGPETKMLDNAIANGTIQEFFLGKDWQSVLPMLQGTDFLKGLQEGSTKIIKMPGADQGSEFYVGVPMNSKVDNLKDSDIIFAISL